MEYVKASMGGDGVGYIDTGRRHKDDIWFYDLLSNNLVF